MVKDFTGGRSMAVSFRIVAGVSFVAMAMLSVPAAAQFKSGHNESAESTP